MLSQLFVAGGLDQTADKPLLQSTDKSEAQFGKHNGRHTVGYSLENVSA